MGLDAFLRRHNRQAAATSETRNAAIVRMFRRQNGKCYLCGEQMTLKTGAPRTATIDHVTPKSRVKNAEAFYRIKGTRKAACWSCNNQKGDKLPHLSTKGRP